MKQPVKKKAKKPTPKMLGSGMAAKAGKALKNRGKSVDDAVMEAMGMSTKKKKKK